MSETSKTPNTKPTSSPLTGIKKRRQIEIAGRAMFVWVAIAAVALSFCIASGQYLFSKWQYNNKIVSAKYEASGTLTNNIAAIETLKQEVDALVADQNLASVKTNENDPNIKSILDALPTTYDPAALAASLQEVVLARSGVAIEGISVPPEIQTIDDEDAPAQDDSALDGPQEITFTFVVTGSFDQIKDMTRDLGRSIRPIRVTSVSMSGNAANLRATFEAVTFFQPAKSVEIQEEVIR